jgi:hypothetical protein
MRGTPRPEYPGYFLSSDAAMWKTRLVYLYSQRQLNRYTQAGICILHVQ